MSDSSSEEEGLARESKQLALQLKENEDKYIRGELDLNETLDKTDLLFNRATESRQAKASGVIQDCDLLDIQTRITRKCVLTHKIDHVFDPREFSIKIRNKFLTSIDASSEGSLKSDRYFPIWEKLGEYSKKYLHTVPKFSYMYGTFESAPVENVRKERRKVEKDKIEALKKPEIVKDGIRDGTAYVPVVKMLRFFHKYIEKSTKKAICFYEFVMDPTSFTRTVENIFHVSLLVKEKLICLFSDNEGMPFLRLVTDEERSSSTMPPNSQTVISMSMDEWEAIIKKFNFKTPLIPPKIKP